MQRRSSPQGELPPELSVDPAKVKGGNSAVKRTNPIERRTAKLLKEVQDASKTDED
jgi:hypothetical protein